MVQGKGGVLRRYDRTSDVSVILRADAHRVRANDARLLIHPGRGRRAGAEALSAMVLFPIQLSNSESQAGCGPSRMDNMVGR